MFRYLLDSSTSRHSSFVRPPHYLELDRDTNGSVPGWVLRAWKIYQLDQLEKAELTENTQEQDGNGRESINAQDQARVTDETTFAAFLLKGSWVFAIRRV